MQKGRKPRCSFLAPENWSSKRGKGQRLRFYVANVVSFILCFRQRVLTACPRRRLGPGSLGPGCGRGCSRPLCLPAPRRPRRVRRPSAQRGSGPRARKPPADSAARAKAGFARPPPPWPYTPRVNSSVRLSRGRLARPAVSTNLPLGPASWRARPGFHFLPSLNQRVRSCVSVLLLKIAREWRGSYTAVSNTVTAQLVSAEITGPLLLRSPAQNGSRLPRKPDALRRACFSVWHHHKERGKHVRLSGELFSGVEASQMQQNRPGRGPLSVGSGRGGSARGQGSPGLALRGGPTRPSGARGRTRGLGREPAWVGEAESSDSPGRRGSHSLPSETPPHSAAHPPSRGWLLRGCSSPAGRRAAVSPRRAPAVRLPRAAAAARQPCAVLESAVAAAGKGCGIAALRLILDDAASASTPSARSRSR